ncbi:hypothetical protein NEF87_000901 [Candidatus Lokiarchaeum ossiferum]|uniref:DUF4886 domain-containing protein n=1 Tax=Candidatus Lokiarchaeum ossiferum TaxID=2951803 RepID=A0ABY6HMH3_9ARCH|nr:hypothetical protein NEF87_000901 [Candidatus Lokiarchaeum sp. B-35]
MKKPILLFFPLLSTIIISMHFASALCVPIIPMDNTDNVSILFIGNSLTGYHDMPQLFQNFSNSAEKNVNVDSALVYGASLTKLLQSAIVLQKINSQQWDFIILQSDDTSAFPDLYEKEINLINAFKKEITRKSPYATILYFMVWGLRDGVSIQEIHGEFVHYSYSDYMTKIKTGTMYIASHTQVAIVPIGVAWENLIGQDQSYKNKLFGADNAHPAPLGSYMGAAVVFVSIFQENCSTSFFASIDPKEAQKIQKIASDTVLEEIGQWKLTSKLSNEVYQEIPIWLNSSQRIEPGKIHLEWDFNESYDHFLLYMNEKSPKRILKPSYTLTLNSVGTYFFMISAVNGSVETLQSFPLYLVISETKTSSISSPVISIVIFSLLGLIFILKSHLNNRNIKKTGSNQY